MNKIFALLACAPLLLGACHRHDAADDELNHHHNHGGGETEAEAENKNGDEIVLHHDMAERFGVRVDTLRPAPMVSSLRATGVVLDAADGAAVVVAPVAGTVRFASGIVPGAHLNAGATVATINAAATLES